MKHIKKSMKNRNGKKKNMTKKREINAGYTIITMDV